MEVIYDESFLALRFKCLPFYDISPIPIMKKEAVESQHKSKSNRLKVLVLHGWGQDAELGISSMKRIIDRLGKNGIDLKFMTAPHSLPSKTRINLEGKHVEVYNFPPDRNPYAWFLYTQNKLDQDKAFVPNDFLSASLPYHGWSESVQAIGEFWKKEEDKEGTPFDGVIGFSQGATMAHILCSLKCHKSSIPQFDLSWLHSFKFAVFAGGFPSSLSRPPAPIQQLDIPSLHFSGENDKDVPRSIHYQLASCFENPIIHEHSKGHIVPNNSADIGAMTKFFEQFRTSS